MNDLITNDVQTKQSMAPSPTETFSPQICVHFFKNTKIYLCIYIYMHRCEIPTISEYFLGHPVANVVTSQFFHCAPV